MISNIIWANYTELGDKACAIGNHNLGGMMFEAALEVALRSDVEDPRLALSFDNLTMVYQQQGQSQRIAPLCKQVLFCCERARGAGRRSLASTLNNLAELYFKQGDLARSRALYRKVLYVFEQIYGSNHAVLVPRLKRLGVICYKLGRFGEALVFYNRAQNICRAQEDVE